MSQFRRPRLQSLQQEPYVQPGMYQQRQTPPPPVPPPQPKPPTRKQRKPLPPWQYILVGVLVAFIIGTIFGYAAHATTSSIANSTQQPTMQTTTIPTSAPTVALSPTPTPKPTHTPKPAHTLKPTPTPKSAHTSRPTPTHTPLPPPKWTTVQTFTGNGTKKTGIFIVSDDWKLLWSCNPSSWVFGQYNVIVEVLNSDNSVLDDAAVHTICKAGNTGGETEEHQGGDVYLSVNSEAAWTIQIQELK